MDYADFGRYLSQQRELRGMTLQEVQKATRIPANVLGALEEGRVERLPARVFVVNYIRAYAQAIGLDADAVVREFLARFPDPLDEPGAELPSMAESSRRPPSRLRFLIGSAIGALPSRRAQAAPPVELPGGPAPTVDADPTGDPAPTAHDNLMERRVPEPVAAGPEPTGPDMSALARLCVRLAGAAELHDVASVLDDSVRLLDAVGLVVWRWDPQPRTLRPVLIHGYADDVAGQLRGVPSDADNAIAIAFRSMNTCVVEGSATETGAIVVPLTIPGGCAGVLAIELRHGAERREPVRACATILAAQLSTLAGEPPVAHAVSA